jgi:cell division protein FtsB
MTVAGRRSRFVNAAFTVLSHAGAMVTRTRLRAVMTALGLYTVAALIIGYFGLSAYSGAHGLKAKQNLAQQQATLTAELERVRAERKQWEHRVSLLRADRLDPDLLDERARAMLNYAHPRDLVFSLKK